MVAFRFSNALSLPVLPAKEIPDGTIEGSAGRVSAIPAKQKKNNPPPNVVEYALLQPDNDEAVDGVETNAIYFGHGVRGRVAGRASTCSQA
jgi:hypothetical protein